MRLLTSTGRSFVTKKNPRNAPWADIKKCLSRDRKPRAYCAISFIGTGAVKLLPLRAGDVLVCNASKSAVKSGITDPRELLKFYKLGVDIYSHQSLHAKIIAVGSTTWIGSHNASNNSANNLIEAGAKIVDPKFAASSREFIIECAGEGMSLKSSDLKKLIEIYRPPRIEPEAPDLQIQRMFLWDTNTTTDLIKLDAEDKKKLKNDGTKAALELDKRGQFSKLEAIHDELGEKSKVKRWDWIICAQGNYLLRPGQVHNISKLRSKEVYWVMYPKGLKARIPIEVGEEVVKMLSDKEIERAISTAKTQKILSLFETKRA